MTVETDVSKEVIAIENKCGSDSNVNADPDNSYVFVSENDGLVEDHVDLKERDSQAVVGGENGELDDSEGKKEVIENVAGFDDVPVINEEGKIEECVVSDGETVGNNDENVEKVVESESDRVEVSDRGVESSVAMEKEAVTDQNGSLGSVEGLNEVSESSTGAGDHQDEILLDEANNYGEDAKEESGTVESGDQQDMILQDEAKSFGEEAKDETGTTESGDQQDGVLQDEAKSDVEHAKDETETVESGGHQDEILQGDVKSDGEKAKDETGRHEQSDHQDEATRDGEEAKYEIGTAESGDHPDEILQDEAKSDVEHAKAETRMVESGDHQDRILQDEANSDFKQAKDETGTLESGDHQDGFVQDEAKSDVDQAKDEIGTHERLEGSETEVVADPNGSSETVADSEIERVEDTNKRMDSSISEEIREGDHQNGISQDEAEQAQIAIESLDGSASEVVVVPNENVQIVDENDIKQAEDHSETIKTLGEAKAETDGDQLEKLECVAGPEVRELEVPNDKDESLGVAESEMVNEQHENIEGGEETLSKEVEDVNDISESAGGAETENLVDQKNEVVAESIIVTDRKNDGDFELVSDHKNDGSAEAETATNKTNESAETEKVVQESDNLAEQKSDHESETEMVADHIIEAVVETERVTDETNDSVVETQKVTDQSNDDVVVTENVTDQTNERGVETELQKCEDQIELESSAAPIDSQEPQVQDKELFNEFGNESGESGICKESKSVIDDPVETKFQEVSSKGLDEIKLAETVNDEIPPATAVSDIEAHPVDSNVETLEEQANVALVSDSTENQKYETEPVIEGELQQVDEVETAVVGDDKQVEIVREIPKETIEKNLSVSHGEDVEQSDEEPEMPLEGSSGASKLTQIENEIEASEPAQTLTASCADKLHSDIDVLGAETASFSPVDSPKSQIVESCPSNQDKPHTGSTNDASSESNSVAGMTVSAEREQTLVNGDVHVEYDVPGTVSNQPDSVDGKLESGSNLVLETAGGEETGNQVDSPKATTEDNSLLQEENIDNSQSEGVSGASKEDSSTGATIELETSIAAVIKPFNYIMRVPRFNDESLKERIRQAKLQIEEKTKVRDAIQSQIQQIRANGQIHGVDYEYAKGEIRNARKLVRTKRVEIDSLHSVINKAKNALSIDDIDTRIYSMEHMMQHETLPLKEEKQFIREIKQLKSLRDELSSNMGSDDEVKQALEQREEAEERLKVLRKDLEKLKGEVQKAESAAMEAERKYEDENQKVKELQAQFRAANDVRQEAYARWLSLRKELSEKNKYFFKYKDDTAAANNYAFRRDRESLYRLCTDQVDQLMELWNTNEDFRKEYVSFNVRSTVRRFGTLDGRALSPDEEPPILPSYVDDRVHRFVSTPTNTNSVSKSVVELKSDVTVEKGTVNDKSVKKITENENQKVKSKEIVEPVLANGLPTAALQTPDEVMNEPVKSREEIELDRKAEEMRRKEDDAKLKEQRRLEGLAKANEARERKKRQAEKMQVRAELKARKEAEEKEKEREKRLRKKEKKKGTDSNDGNNNSDSAPSESAVEIVREIDSKDITSAVTKKPQKIVKSNKKISSIPAHIRNRNKKKWQNYAYVTLAGILVLVLFWVGNVSLFTDKTFMKPNPFH